MSSIGVFDLLSSFGSFHLGSKNFYKNHPENDRKGVIVVWFALILALGVGGLVGIFTRNLRKALKFALITLLGGISLSILIILSGILGG